MVPGKAGSHRGCIVFSRAVKCNKGNGSELEKCLLLCSFMIDFLDLGESSVPSNNLLISTRKTACLSN